MIEIPRVTKCLNNNIQCLNDRNNVNENKESNIKEILVEKEKLQSQLSLTKIQVDRLSKKIMNYEKMIEQLNSEALKNKENIDKADCIIF